MKYLLVLYGSFCALLSLKWRSHKTPGHHYNSLLFWASARETFIYIWCSLPAVRQYYSNLHRRKSEVKFRQFFAAKTFVRCKNMTVFLIFFFSKLALITFGAINKHTRDQGGILRVNFLKGKPFSLLSKFSLTEMVIKQ